MARQGIVAALILLGTACAAPSSRPGSTPAAALEVDVDLEETGPSPRRGDLALASFRIHNAGKNPLILRDLRLPRDLMRDTPSGAVATWQYAQPGLLTYNPDRDEWLYDRGHKSVARRPVFNSGLLLPGESIPVRARIRLLEMPIDFQFSYFELPPEEIRRKIYFEVRQEKETRYKPLIGEELAKALTPDLRPEAASHRIVIFPHAEPVRASALLLKTVRIDRPLEDRPFGLDQAARKAGIPRPGPGQYTYSTRLDGWILPKEGGHLLVTSSGVRPLPALREMERIFYLIDTSLSTARIEVELRGDSVASTFQELKYPLVSRQKESSGIRDYFLFVAAADLPRLFADLRTLKLTLEAEFSETGGRLQVSNR